MRKIQTKRLISIRKYDTKATLNEAPFLYLFIYIYRH